jgi:hypothetical protein
VFFLKKIFLIASILIIVFAGVYTFVKMSASLEAKAAGFAKNKKVQLISIGNKGSLGDIQIERIRINGNKTPEYAKIQVSNDKKGFLLGDFTSEETKGYTFKNLQSVKLQPHTGPDEQLERLHKGKESDQIYALSLADNISIQEVTISYRHLGISHQETISTGL